MMQAYKYKDLYNKLVQQNATEAFESQGIGTITFKNILEAHPSKLYTPNFFIRFALGLLMAVAVLFSALLVWLISCSDHDYSFIILFIFFSIACYAALEIFIRAKQFYNAGVDNVLMSCSILFLIAAFLTENYANNYIVTSAAIMLFCLWLCIRFIDAFMAMLTILALYILVFFLCLKVGTIGRAIAPFLLMLLCAIVYLAAHKLLKKDSLMLYHFSCKTVEIAALVLLYGSVNFYVVDRAGKQMFSPAESMPDVITMILWICTLVILPAYILYGIFKKDITVIRIAVILFIAAVLTVHYYYAVLPPEVDMLIGGIVLIAGSYMLIRYLRTSKYGFSFENNRTIQKTLLNVEALIIGQVFGKSHAKDKGFEFGGGSSGGGGATGDF